MPTDSVYERIGLPIYIRKSFADDFELYMGFKALPSVLMEKAIKEKISLKIDGKKIYRINTERFSCDSTSLIPIDYIPIYGLKYRINYEPSNKAFAISQHWSEYAQGFLFDGALFTVSEKGGRKIQYGDSVTTDVEYYWVRRQSELPMFIPGISMEKVGKLVLKDSKWTVFRGCFESNISDAESNCLTNYLRFNLKIHLLEKQPEFIPIWPPVIKTEEGYLLEPQIQKVHGYIVSGNDIPKIYAYRGIQALPEEVYPDGHVASISILDQNMLINIDRKYVSSGTLLLKALHEMTEFNSEIYELDSDGGLVIIDGFLIQRDNDELRFQIKQHIEIVLFRKSGQIERYKGTGDYTFKNLHNGDLIYILQGRYLVSMISVFKKELKQKKIVIDDNRLYTYFLKYQNAKKVKLPHRMRVQLYILNEQSTLSENGIEQILHENMIASPLLRVLEDMINEQN